MAKRDPNKFEVKGNPSIWVTILRHGREGDHDKDARWHYVFYYNGKRHRGSTGKIEHADAIVFAHAEAEKVRDFKPHPAGGLTLSAAIAKSLATRWPVEQAKDDAGETVSNESYSDAKGRLTAFSESTGETSLSSLDFDGFTHMVQAYLDKRRAAEMSGRTIKNDQLVISAFFSWLMKAKDEHGKRLVPQLKSNPAQKDLLTLPPAESVKLPDLNDVERKALIKAARGTELWPVVVLCLGAGFRPKGACVSPWSKFDLERGTFTVMEKNVERVVPLSDWTWKELKTWTASHSIDTASQTVWPYHHDTAHDQLAKLRTKHGLSARTTLQALRRTADTLLYAAGVNPQEAAGIMGHTIQTAERHYVRAMATDRVKVQALDFTEKDSAQPHKKPRKRKAKTA